MSTEKLVIGIPREILAAETRVAATPETVAEIVAAGHRVLVEAGAGDRAFIDDARYTESGAEVVQNAQDIYRQASVILKVKEPQFNEKLGKQEAELYTEGTVLICFLHPANKSNHEMLNILARRGITSYTLDGVPRISRAQQMDALTAMSTCAGYKATIFAAGHIGGFVPMIPTSFGVLSPSQFLVVGVGVAGLQAIATAKRLGAKVKAIDIRAEANDQARSLGAEIIEFDVPADLAMGQGGYARRLPEEWYAKEREALAPHVATSDAVILSALIPGEVAPIMVDDAMLKQMKKGSTVIDIAVDQGGNCSATRAGEEYDHNGVIISGVKNIPATLPVASTNMFAQSIFHFFSYIFEGGAPRTDSSDEIVGSTMVTYENKIVHTGTLKSMGLAE